MWRRRLKTQKTTVASVAATVSSREVDDDCSDERQDISTAYHHRAAAGLT